MITLCESCSGSLPSHQSMFANQWIPHKPYLEWLSIRFTEHHINIPRYFTWYVPSKVRILVPRSPTHVPHNFPLGGRLRWRLLLMSALRSHGELSIILWGNPYSLLAGSAWSGIRSKWPMFSHEFNKLNFTSPVKLYFILVFNTGHNSRRYCVMDFTQLNLFSDTTDTKRVSSTP